MCNCVIFQIGKPGTNKKGFWIDGGIHAREWISPAIAVYIINDVIKPYCTLQYYNDKHVVLHQNVIIFFFQLVTKYGSDAKITKYVDTLDWYIVPSVNPDGYEYSRKSVSFT